MEQLLYLGHCLW